MSPDYRPVTIMKVMKSFVNLNISTEEINGESNICKIPNQLGMVINTKDKNENGAVCIDEIRR